MPLKIPLQPKRIKSHSISRICRLKDQIRRFRIHRILKSPPQKSRQVWPCNHPPIPQPNIKNSSIRSPARHRMPTPSPNLHLMPTFFRTRIALRKSDRRHQDHKSEDKEQEKENTAPAVWARHGLAGCPTSDIFASPHETGKNMTFSRAASGQEERGLQPLRYAGWPVARGYAAISVFRLGRARSPRSRRPAFEALQSPQPQHPTDSSRASTVSSLRLPSAHSQTHPVSQFSWTV